jgi:Flp pilus assembly protein TadD
MIVPKRFMPLVLLSMCLPACRPTGPDRPDEMVRVEVPGRDAERAEELNRQAASHMRKGDVVDAQRLARQALQADGNHGPSHNTLGVAYLKQRRLADAAESLSRAAALMPDSPAPAFNLGLVWDAAGRRAKAEQQYRKALQVDPEHVPAMGNLARNLILSGRKGPELRELLQKLVLKDARPDWAAWARREREMLGDSSEGTATQPSESP